jgi:hypothetical protein
MLSEVYETIYKIFYILELDGFREKLIYIKIYLHSDS